MTRHGDTDAPIETDLRSVCERCKAEGRTVEVLPHEVLAWMERAEAAEAEVQRLRRLQHLTEEKLNQSLDREVPQKERAEALQADKERLKAALLRIEPNIGWRSTTGEDPGLYYCEFCHGKHADLRLVPHSDICIVTQARAALSGSPDPVREPETYGDMVEVALGMKPSPVRELEQAVVKAAMAYWRDSDPDSPDDIIINLSVACNALAKAQEAGNE